MKKSDIVQELVNIYPLWSKVRTDEQSVGYQYLNSIALPIEYLEKQLLVIRDNQYLSTANLDEIDILYRVQLDSTFEFDIDPIDPLISRALVPEVSGLMDGTWYNVNIAEQNDIRSFWYDSIPDRISLNETLSGVDHDLLSLDSTDVPVSGLFEHHNDGGRLWIEATGGVEYLQFNENAVTRAKIIIAGETRKGTYETETLVFPWDMKQQTLKEWKYIDNVSAYDIEDGVEIDIRSADFNGGPYLSPWNFKYSVTRRKIDEFWDIGHNGNIPTLDRIEYQSDEWQQLVLGFSSKDVKESWELLDGTENVLSGVDITISGVDMAIQPYTDNAWIVTSGNQLYVYDLSDELVSGIQDLKDSTPGSHIQFDYDNPHVLFGEPIEFIPWHARPLKELQSYRLWYQRPDGEKFGLLNGSPVAFSSDFEVKVPDGTILTRTVENFIEIPTTQRGEYLVVFEAVFVDGEEQEYRRIFSTKYKEPLATFDLTPFISGVIDGIDFDSDQKLWVKSADEYFQIQLHKDIMLIDYTNKILYFTEPYSEVTIETND